MFSNQFSLYGHHCNSVLQDVNTAFCEYMRLQDILSCLNPRLPAALMKCLYLLVCLPAEKEIIGKEETFQEPLAQVSGKTHKYTFIYFAFILHITPY